MTRILSALAVVLLVTTFAGQAYGGESPVVVSHKLTRYEKGTKLVTVGYTLHVVNRADKPVSNLTFRVFGSAFIAKTAVVNVGTLAPGQGSDVSVETETPAPPKSSLLRQPLFLAGKCLDSEGKVLEFATKTFPGGGR